jgi:hypothetical protein
MREKKKLQDKLREMELAYLVEGQANSVCAIRLKETLPLKKHKLVLPPVMTDQEKLRVDELMLSGSGCGWGL